MNGQKIIHTNDGWDKKRVEKSDILKNSETLEYWNIRLSKYWNVGMLECWNVKILEHSFIGILEQPINCPYKQAYKQVFN